MTDNRTYFEQVKADVEQYMEEHEQYFDMSDYRDADDFRNDIYEKMWIADSVTGNGSGSYTFNSYEAKEHVLNDMDTVREALNEFCVDAQEIGERFLNEDWEYLDVTARCYVLGLAVGEYIEENEEAIEKAIEEANEENEEE